MFITRKLSRLRRFLFCGKPTIRTAVRLVLVAAGLFLIANFFLSWQRPVEFPDSWIERTHNSRQEKTAARRLRRTSNRQPAGFSSKTCPVLLPYYGVGTGESRAYEEVKGRAHVHEELAERFSEHTGLQHVQCRNLHKTYSRALLFACPRPQCIGLMDGLRGLLLSYVVAVVSNRLFFVRAGLWMPLEKYLIPPKNWRSLDWTIEGCAVTQQEQEIIFRNNLERSLPQNFLRSSDPNCNIIFSVLKSRRRVVSLLTDLDLSCANKFLVAQGFNIDRRKHRSVFDMAFSRLFRFSDNLQDKARQFQIREQWNPSRSVCIHVRTGSFQTDRHDVGHKNLDDFWHCARLLEKVAGLDDQEDVTWMVFGDNDTSVDRARKFLSKECADSRRVLSTRFLGVQPQHDLAANEEELERVFFDMLMLSKCKYTVGSKSQFVTFSASLGMQTKIFLLVKEQRLMDKPLTDICHQVVPDWDGHYVIR